MTEPQPPQTMELASPDEELGGKAPCGSWRGSIEGSFVEGSLGRHPDFS